MANADWEVKNVIDYSPNGDDIDMFSQKVKAEEGVIYERLNRVRANDASAGVSVSDAVPYQWHIDTSTNPATVLLLDGKSGAWKRIGYVAENFGLDTEDLGGIVNGGGLTTISLGKDASKPSTAKSNALFFAYDAKKIYRFTGNAWEIFLSLDYDDIQDKEESAVSWDDVATSGANKVAKFNREGILEADISGSPAKLASKTIAVSSLSADDAMVYDGTRWENKKVATVSSDGIANVSISGNAAKIANRNIVATNLDEGDAFVFDGTRFVNKQVPVVDGDGLIRGNISGSAAKIAGMTIRTDNLSDGQVLVYRSATNTFVNEQKGTVGAGAAISFQRGGVEFMSYDGSEERVLEFDDFAKEAVGVGTNLPDPGPLHFVEVQA
ncbi:MAG: hypothetical protein IJ521_02145 [Schwartzia sp.]|nr:hypothetical protein [Schwartzia sp. (in: firmicutes)]